MAGNASRNNGKKGGHPKGVKNTATLEREAVAKAYQQLVLEKMRPILDAQMTLALGVGYLYRIDENVKGGREHSIVTNPDEIGDVLSQMHENGDGVYNDKYYYISTKAPDGRTLDSLLDRAMGKPSQNLDLTTKGKELPVPILHVLPDNCDQTDSGTQ